jgi:hypothetical protein
LKHAERPKELSQERRISHHVVDQLRVTFLVPLRLIIEIT